MYTIDILLIVCAGVGAVLIIAALFLLYKGVIKLENAASSGSLSVELANSVKISTTFPGAVLFIIGAIMVGGPIVLADRTETIDVKGKLQATGSTTFDGTTLELCRNYENMQISSDGSIIDQYFTSPNIKYLHYDLIVPGVVPPHSEATVELTQSNVVDLGTIVLGKRVISDVTSDDSVKGSSNSPNNNDKSKHNGY